MNIDPDLIEEKITPRTKAIIPVHFAGRPCAMNEIMAIAGKHNLLVIEDAAHALEARYDGKKIGTIGHATCFSFYATKNVTTGEGGMVATDDEDCAHTIATYANHGMTKGAWKRYSEKEFKHYEIICPGYNYNMMDMQAAIGVHQLARVEQYLERREEIWQHYDVAFKDVPVITPAPAEPHIRHARHLYTLLLDGDSRTMDRDSFLQALHTENIGASIHYIVLSSHPYYREKFGYKKGDFPNAEYISERTISLPLSAKLSDEDVNDVIKAVKKVLR
jgi:dTDP-4-amino-4,6-dideoxygalactose transaminase